MTERFEPKLYEEIKAYAIRLAERAEEFKKLVLRANDVENTSAAFDEVLDVIQDTKECLEEELGEGAFEVEDDEEPDLIDGNDPDADLEEDEIEEEEIEDDGEPTSEEVGS